MYAVYCVVIYFTLFRFCENTEDAVVNTTHGIIKGKYWKTYEGRTFIEFLGIPYAKPPIGELRFEPPAPADPWEGILEATKPHEVCPQIFIYSSDQPIIGNEDCLFLNIYTPQIIPTENRLPVMFYIHGGSFIMGSARNDWIGPEILLNKDVVLVTVNYRLGALGFLSTLDTLVSGNNGLKDQTLALKWVKSNIENFGGDPNKITIFGNSAGAVSAHYHTLSPLSRGLFTSVILESGVVIVSFNANSDAALKNARQLGEYLNCSTATNEKLISCLKNSSVYDIIIQQAKFENWDNDTTIVPFTPVIEVQSNTSFISEDPIDAIKEGKTANVPIMIGMVPQECGYKSATITMNEKALLLINRYFHKITSSEFAISGSNETATSALKNFYFGDKTIGNTTKSALTDMYTDGWFLWGIDLSIRLHVQHAKQPIYLYLFEYQGSVSYSQLFGDPTFNYGVTHTDELLYLLPRQINFPGYIPKDFDKKVADTMSTLWVNFATYGNPTPETSFNISEIWTPVVSSDLEYYHIKNFSDLSMNKGMLLNRAKFWRSLPIRGINNEKNCK